MTTRKPRRTNNGSGNHHRPNHNGTQPSDYESDYPNYFSDTQQQQEQHMPPPPLRSNEELNLSVLRRHNPSVNTILSLAPYAVVYLFNPTSRQWEKSGVEGSLFVCQLSQGSLGEERYSVFVLNRRGLNNFDILLTDGDNVELTEEYWCQEECKPRRRPYLRPLDLLRATAKLDGRNTHNQRSHDPGMRRTCRAESEDCP